MKKLLLLIFILFLAGVKVVYDFFPIKYYEEIIEVSEIHQVDPIIILAMIKVESDFRLEAKSHKGALGLMQLMPTTADWILEKEGYNPSEFDMFNPRDNIFTGTLYFKYLREKFDGDMEKIMAAYNGGSTRVRNNTWHKINETVNYVKKIDWAMKAYTYKLPIYLKIRSYNEKIRNNFNFYRK